MYTYMCELHRGAQTETYRPVTLLRYRSNCGEKQEQAHTSLSSC